MSENGHLLTKSSEKLAGLVRTLQTTQRRIREIVGTNADAIMTPNGAALLLPDAQDFLRSTSKNFREMFRDSALGVITADAQGKLTEVSGAFCRLTGYAAGEIRGAPLASLIFIDDRHGFSDSLNALIAGERRSFITERRLVGRDGAPVWVRASVSGQFGPSGALVGMHAIIEDIGERKRVELLRESETRVLELISTGAPLEMSLEEIALAVDAATPGAMSSILLLEPDGAHLRTAAAPGLPPGYAEAIAVVPVGPREGACGAAVHRREQVIIADMENDPLAEGYRDALRPYGLRACWSTPIFDSKGAVLATFAIYWREVRKPDADEFALIVRFAHLVSLAIERVRRENALRESEERFRFVSNATADVIWDWDLTAGKVWWNDGIRTVFGYENVVAGGEAQPWIDCIHPEDIERVLTSVRAVVESLDSHWSDEYRFRRADGEYADVINRGFVIRGSDGASRRMVGSIEDVTEQRALEEQLRQSQRLDALGQLTGGVAHDFNNLLTVILGNADTLSESLADDPRLFPLAELTRTAAGRGAELTNRLLAFARRQALNAKATDVNALVSGMEDLLRRTLGQHIEIDIERGGDLWRALIDGPQLESALLNLCLNARDAMPEGGRLVVRTGNICLSHDFIARFPDAVPGDYVAVEVADTGVGMGEATLARVFDPFFTTKEVGKGSGLGLSMVYGFVKQSKGHISISSNVGAGTIVTLFLPRAAKALEQESVEAPEEAEPRGAERILLVEDDELVRRHVGAQLKSFGYDVVSMRNGAEAIAYLERGETCDLLFTDIVMPGGVNGRQLAEEARRRRPGLRVLFTSGYAETARDAVEPADLGGALLQKPYRRQDLAARIRGALDAS